jgi:spermidine/putrescine-binding protein
MNQGVVVGQTWDGPPTVQMKEGLPVVYRAPIEGSLAWVDGLCLSSSSKNEDQAYAFLDFCFDAQAAGRSIDGGGIDGWDQSQRVTSESLSTSTFSFSDIDERTSPA